MGKALQFVSVGDEVRIVLPHKDDEVVVGRVARVTLRYGHKSGRPELGRNNPLIALEDGQHFDLSYVRSVKKHNPLPFVPAPYNYYAHLRDSYLRLVQTRKSGVWMGSVESLMVAVIASFTRFCPTIIDDKRCRELFQKDRPGIIRVKVLFDTNFYTVKSKPFKRWVWHNLPKLCVTAAEMDRREDLRHSEWENEWFRDMQSRFGEEDPELESREPLDPDDDIDWGLAQEDPFGVMEPEFELPYP